jgi:hypothetical protein
MKKRSLITSGLSASLLLALAAAQPAQAQLFGRAPPPPVGIAANVDADKAFAALIDDGAALRHLPKVYNGAAKTVALTSVELQFVTETSVSAKTKAFIDSRYQSSQDVTYKLLGVDPKAFQTIADQFGADLRQAIEARGYQVLDQNAVAKATPEFAARVKEAETPSVSKGVFTNSGSTAVAAKGTAFVATGMFGTMQTLKAVQALGDAVAFDVKLVINFAQLENSTDFFSQFGAKTGDTITLKTQITHGLQTTLVEEKSSVGVGNASGYTPYPFLRVGVTPNVVSKEVVNAGASGGQVAANLLVGLLSMGKQSASSTNFEATAAENYSELMSADLKNVARVLAAALEKK